MDEKKLNTLKALLEDAPFKKQLMSAETVEKAIALLKDKGIELTLEELKSAFSAVNGELSDEDLDSVAGGALTPPWWFEEKTEHILLD